jgi:N-acetylglucosamine kinase-like BadF-type ATPase
MERALVEVLIREVFGAITVAGFGESEIALACADMTWGISLIAGTGASCRACDANGHWNGCGGFGPQFGDEGSGYWIGREAVAALLRVEDGRGGATTLHQAVCGAFGIENVRDIYRFVDRSGHVSGTRIASLVPLVFEAARGGDRVAIAICRLAGEELGRLACATARQVEWSSTPVPLVASGGVFHAGALVIEPMVAALKECPVAMEAPRVVTEPTEGIIKLLLAGSDRLD